MENDSRKTIQKVRYQREKPESYLTWKKRITGHNEMRKCAPHHFHLHIANKNFKQNKQQIRNTINNKLHKKRDNAIKNIKNHSYFPNYAKRLLKLPNYNY